MMTLTGSCNITTQDYFAENEQGEKSFRRSECSVIISFKKGSSLLNSLGEKFIIEASNDILDRNLEAVSLYGFLSEDENKNLGKTRVNVVRSQLISLGVREEVIKAPLAHDLLPRGSFVSIYTCRLKT